MTATEDDATTAREKLRADIAAQGRRLAAAVWKPVENGTRSARLLIVPDGALQYVPFAALPSSAGGPVLARHELGTEVLWRHQRAAQAASPSKSSRRSR